MESKQSSPRDLELAFDVGHSSIGWAALQNKAGQSVDILGCGAVIFRADDCLASSRRAYRRQRRHIRSTRQRIARLKMLLKHLGVLTDGQLDQTVSSSPWQLAASVLACGKPLSWPQLWDVLRWYAHNRGYRRWSAAEAEAKKEDSDKEANARSLLQKHGVNSMAEVFCKQLGLEPLGEKTSSMIRFKGLNAAFPREIVEAEVRRILKAHVGHLGGVDEHLEEVIFSDWRAIPCPEIKLPRRYKGGLLFGQLVPRFDNRIISVCPISGEKVPSRNCREFLDFRWGMQLANIRVGNDADRELRPLHASERLALDGKMRENGYMTPGELKDAVRAISGCGRNNLETMLLHPDAKEALVVDPIQKLITSEDLSPFWKRLPERNKKRLKGQWRRGKTFTLAQIAADLKSPDDLTAFDRTVDQRLAELNSQAKNAAKQRTREDFLRSAFPTRTLRLEGRAAFARHLLKQAYAETLAGKHPKEPGGCLFPSEEARKRQEDREIAQQTNNHLVRHRLLILERLLADILKEYCAGDKMRIAKITVEVNRDLREMSGKDAQAKAKELGQKLANFKSVTGKLEESYEGKGVHISPGLIRKARVAEDLGWVCPYSGKPYDAFDLLNRRVDVDHIVPRSDRPSDSLDSLAITFSEINKWKSNRTALQFVQQEQGKSVPGLPSLSIVSLNRFRDFVSHLESFKGHDDDKRRKKRRKELLLLPAYEEKTFLPRDLTQTSQLVRLAAQALKKAFKEQTEPPPVISLPGAVTGAVRKAWKVTGCLSLANPQVLDENGDVKTKTEIRDITHLHHALDACVLGLASRFIPNNGRIWELIVKRNVSEAERNELTPLGVFGFSRENRFQMLDLDDSVKEKIRQRLAEKRVVQHVPARMEGLRVEQNTWRVVSKNEAGTVPIRQRIRQPDGARKKKDVPEKKAKLLGLAPSNGIGKLAAIKGVLVIPENYGVAILDHTEIKTDKLVIIPWHLVYKRVFKGISGEKSLVERNGGKAPRILRNGQIIMVGGGTYKGKWRVTSIKNQNSGIKLNLGQPDTVNTEEEALDLESGKRARKVRPHCKHEASLASIVSCGLQILAPPLVGAPSQPS